MKEGLLCLHLPVMIRRGIQGELLSLHEDPEALKNKVFSEDDL